MADDLGNPRIAELGMGTRFGVGICPRAAQKRASRPWSIKRAVRRLMSEEFSLDEMPLTEARLIKVFNPKGSEVTGVQALAIRLLLSALEGDLTATKRLVHINEGPTPTEDQIRAELPEDSE